MLSGERSVTIPGRHQWDVCWLSGHRSHFRVSNYIRPLSSYISILGWFSNADFKVAFSKISVLFSLATPLVISGNSSHRSQRFCHQHPVHNIHNTALQRIWSAGYRLITFMLPHQKVTQQTFIYMHIFEMPLEDLTSVNSSIKRDISLLQVMWRL